MSLHIIVLVLLMFLYIVVIFKSFMALMRESTMTLLIMNFILHLIRAVRLGYLLHSLAFIMRWVPSVIRLIFVLGVFFVAVLQVILFLVFY